ncbi:uncharacterized protein BP5553_01522 [Venustampulla echinocandica]|uniref:Uncharacterized protein n=1 Tax=Venustampulla echinocandica TaxID=2656787 RepID=A0A370U1B7_9HELO|nr:uncharacterized protein BP5553_01522 [Venustampulla echinocandica]RDL41543.1 hypothetical protein BP5553_01522 [Venustampulla echinocandica]
MSEKVSKKEEARSAALEAQQRGAGDDDDDALPAYSAMPSQGPTAESPLNFPSDGPSPGVASASSFASASTPTRLQRPIAIPQITPHKSAPFLDAYTRLLLQYGITPESWRAFLTTMSAFLAAKVSDQALAHTADIGRKVGDVPKRFGQDTTKAAKSVGNNIRNSAKSGDYVGAAMGAVSGSISLPIGTAMRAVGALVSLPGATVGAMSQKPQTPRARAAAYAAAANVKWLRQRGLRAQLVDTAELATIAGLPVTRLQALALASEDRSAAGQISALKEYITELETFTGSALEFGASTLWLVIFPDDGVGTALVAGDGLKAKDGN